jgi:hypothetical protein
MVQIRKPDGTLAHHHAESITQEQAEKLSAACEWPSVEEFLAAHSELAVQ